MCQILYTIFYTDRTSAWSLFLPPNKVIIHHQMNDRTHTNKQKTKGLFMPHKASLSQFTFSFQLLGFSLVLWRYNFWPLLCLRPVISCGLGWCGTSTCLKCSRLRRLIRSNSIWCTVQHCRFDELHISFLHPDLPLYWHDCGQCRQFLSCLCFKASPTYKHKAFVIKISFIHISKCT